MADGSIELGRAGVLAPGRWQRSRAMGWMVLLFVVTVAISMLPVVAHVVPGRPLWLGRTLAIVSVLLAYLAYARLVQRGERRRAGEIALVAMPRDIALGLAIGTGMFTLVFASLRLGGLYTLAPGNWNDWPHDIVSAMMTGLVEELMIRAIIFRLLMRAVGSWWALALSAALFGALHLANPHATPFAALAIAVEAGLMLAAFYLLTGRIWMSVGVHAAWNFAQGSIFGARVSGGTETGSLFVSGPVAGTSDVLSGGGFGPEASLSAIVVGAAVFGVVLLAARRAGRV